MKIEYEPGVISYRLVYISIDGTRHYNKYDAIRHDSAALTGTCCVKSSGIYLPNDETYMRIFNITCQEDWSYLYYTEWEQNIFGDKYTHSGLYGSIRHDGGDYPDDYNMVSVKYYLSQLETDLKMLKELNE